MCVCASINPGMPVYLERSITSAPLGIAALLATLRTRSSSTITTALVTTRPVPSINLPNLIAFVAAIAVAGTVVSTTKTQRHKEMKLVIIQSLQRLNTNQVIVVIDIPDRHWFCGSIDDRPAVVGVRLRHLVPPPLSCFGIEPQHLTGV